jgi:hypothetical protein
MSGNCRNFSWGKECGRGMQLNGVFMNPHACHRIHKICAEITQALPLRTHTRHVGTCAYIYVCAASHIFTHMFARAHALQL